LTVFSAVLNPESPYYLLLHDKMLEDYEDNYWAEDAIFMERNSRDFVSRIERINLNAEAICDTLCASPFGRQVESKEEVE
jgi:cystathionine gamma-synthase